MLTADRGGAYISTLHPGAVSIPRGLLADVEEVPGTFLCELTGLLEVTLQSIRPHRVVLREGNHVHRYGLV